MSTGNFLPAARLQKRRGYAVFSFTVILILGSTMFLKILFEIRNEKSPIFNNPLRAPDTVITLLSSGTVTKLAIGLEAITILLLVSSLPEKAKLSGVLLTSWLFLTYHTIHSLYSSLPCPCLGGDWRWLAIHYTLVNTMLYALLVYMLLGSLLFWSQSKTDSS
jgi:hypothetical protein